MADFSALKQSIQNYIKQNGNKEITGAILQNILLSMVTTMGDGAINGNASDISDIKGDVQNINRDITDINGDITDINGAITNINGDITDLNGGLSDEKNRAEGAETTTLLFSDGKLVFKNAAGTVLYQLSVDSFLSAITTRLNTGALYAGYATPSTTPATLTSQEVFYLATQAGTYTNFHFNGGDDPIVLTKDGIYFIVSGDDDDDWNAEPMLQLDDVPTASSNNAVKSGGVAEELALGAVYDVSAKNPTAGPNNDGKWESLSALFSDANLSTLIPASVRKGGMSIKFVQSSDNKYVQYRLMNKNWSIATADWQGVDDEPIVDSKNLVFSGGIYNKIADENSPLYINSASIIKSQGIVSDAGVFDYTFTSLEMLKVKANNKLLYFVESELIADSGYSVVVFFNSSSTVIGTLFNCTQSNDTKKIKEYIPIPDGTEYFVVNSLTGAASVKAYNLYELNKDFYEEVSIKPDEVKTNKLYWDSNRNFLSVNNYNCKKFVIEKDKRYKINVSYFRVGSPGFYAVTFFDKNDGYISSEISYKEYVDIQVKDFILTIPENAAYFLANENTGYSVVVTGITKSGSNIAISVDEADALEHYTDKLYDSENNNLYSISREGHTYECRGYKIIENVSYYITNSSSGDGTRFPMVSYIDSEGDFMSYQFNNEEVVHQKLSIPEDAVFMWINSVDYQLILETFVNIDNYSNYIEGKIDSTADKEEEFDLNMTPIHGQSLSLAVVHATPAIHTTPIEGGFMFNTGVNQVGKTEIRTGIAQLKEGSDDYVYGGTQVENSAWGTSEIIKELSAFNKELLSHKQQFYSICGQDGGGIATQFDTEVVVMRSIMQNLKTLVPYKKIGMPLLYWVQGEYDNSNLTSTQSYKESLINGIGLFSNAAKSIFGQKNDVKCVTYQTSWTDADDREHYTASLAQMELCRDSEMFAPSCPAYILIKGPNDYVHINNWGQYLLGCYQGIQGFSLIVNQRKNIGVMPLKDGCSYSNNKITIKFGVECAPLKFATDWVTQRTNYGFEVIRNGSDIIQSVEIKDVDKVVITCSSNVQSGDVVYYGMQPIKYGFHDMGHGGNLCDSQGDYITTQIDGTTVKLNNYCYSFKFEL